MKIFAILALLALGMTAVLAVYVRLAPADAARLHRLPTDRAPGATLHQNSALVVRASTAEPAAVLAAFDAVAMATPRTVRLAGSVSEGMITYQTRSALAGYPDYTTVGVQDGQLVIHGRSRFGRKDFGVNLARITRWLDAVPGVAPAP